jgi:hypothetical protein
MTTNQQTSGSNAGRRLETIADGSLCHAGLIGGMGKLISHRLFALIAALRFFPKSLTRVVQWVCSPAFPELLPHTPAVRATLITTLALLILPGCVSAHKKGRTIHEIRDYQIVQCPGWYPMALLCRDEIWRDEWTGGGRAFLADPKASELVSLHTNQTALGGSSTLTIGAFESTVSTNGIRAAGEASSQIIQGIGSAAGQLINKSATGTPLK